ncbi:MAG: Gldg family protein, partial [Planctomycetota bacterium]
YFSSPLGYVFICAFVLLSAFAAFWPNRFFNANLANLDQLNGHLPWIMLVFVPAITMSIWAEERRRGTDELLLTLPARDLDIVLGKYLAALAIFTVSLLFSVSNILVLVGLGKPDLGLLAANYVGYWFVGAAMLAVGMVASYLTSNLTVGFVLGAALNAPLVFAAFADAILPRESALLVKRFGLAEQFGDFGRGLVTLSSVVYFAAIAVIGLYVCMVLIGRRHTAGRRAGLPLWAHHLVRAACLVAAAIGVTVLSGRFDLRLDVTAERLSSLSPETKTLLRAIESEQPVFVEAYVSPVVPEAYVQTRLNLLAMLREVDSVGGDRVVVRVNDTERFSREAAEAEEQFGIVAREVQAVSGGRFSVEPVFLGMAFISGLDKVVVPFVDRGIPVEYEVVRSIATVSQQQRRRIGVVQTDARLFGGFDMATMSSRPSQQIVQELRKQYEVAQVNPAAPITERYDVLVAVQPSSLPAASLENLVAAVRAGQPTAIFEDPFPFIDGAVPATSQPRQPPSRNPFMNQPPPEPKGDIGVLWNLLGLEVPARPVVWNEYNPYPNITEFPPEFVFIGAGAGADEPFNRASPITAGLQQAMLLFPGAVVPRPGTALDVEPLLASGGEGGTIDYDQVLQRGIFGPTGLNPGRVHRPTRQTYTLAARVRGPAPPGPATPPDETAEAAPGPAALDVVVTADIDVLAGAFFAIRARGLDERAPVNFQVDNVTYVLNALDALAGDERFIGV